MCRNQHAVLVSVALSAAVAAPAMADIVEFARGPGNTKGGIFIASTNDFGTFDTFCVENNEHIALGVPFEYTVSTDIMFRGNGQVDPLNEETALLYTRFRESKIRDILGKPDLPEDELADIVQFAIWMLEDTLPTDNADALFLVDYAEDAVDNGDWSGLGDVRVMNVWDVGFAGDPEHAMQDQLLLVPSTSTIATACAGLALAGPRRRRS